MIKKIILTILLVLLPISLNAEIRNLKATWDPYDHLATHFKLFENTVKETNGARVVDAYIIPDPNEYSFQSELIEGDTLWFAMQPVNRRLQGNNPNKFGLLTEWVSYSFVTEPIPPEPVDSLPEPIEGFIIEEIME